jgi:hypothetical protein
VGAGELAAIFRGLARDAAQVGQRIAMSTAKLAEKTADIEEGNLGRLLKTDQKAADDIAAAGRRSAGDGRPSDMDTMGRNFDDPSARPQTPKRTPDGYLPAGDPVYHGPDSTAIGYDSSTMRNFDMVKPQPGFHDVVVHGEPDGTFCPGLIGEDGDDYAANRTHPNQVVDAIRNNPSYTGGPLRLVSCHSGVVAPDAGVAPAAQQVADLLGVPVLAPTNAVGVSPRGLDQEEPTLRGGGTWLMFYPQNGG